MKAPRAGFLPRTGVGGSAVLHLRVATHHTLLPPSLVTYPAIVSHLAGGGSSIPAAGSYQPRPHHSKESRV